MDRDLERYQKQFRWKGLGKPAQRRIGRGRVLIVGCGALGSAIAMILARAGVGFLRLIDRDIVELDNLHRQVLFDEADVKEELPKAVAVFRKLRDANSAITLEPVVADVNAANVEHFIRDVDLVMDGMDNIETRFLLNEACVKLEKPWIYTGCIGSEGVSMVIIPNKTPCLRCVFDSAPSLEANETCETAGILAPAALVIASLAATEALKLLGKKEEALQSSLCHADVWKRNFRSFSKKGLMRKTRCPVCGRKQFPLLEKGRGLRATVLCGEGAVQIIPDGNHARAFDAITAKLKRAGKVALNGFFVRAKVGKYQLTVFRDGRTIVNGTSDPGRAKSVYAKSIGH